MDVHHRTDITSSLSRMLPPTLGGRHSRSATRVPRFRYAGRGDLGLGIELEVADEAARSAFVASLRLGATRTIAAESGAPLLDTAIAHLDEARGQLRAYVVAIRPLHETDPEDTPAATRWDRSRATDAACAAAENLALAATALTHLRDRSQSVAEEAGAEPGPWLDEAAVRISHAAALTEFLRFDPLVSSNAEHPVCRSASRKSTRYTRSPAG